MGRVDRSPRPSRNGLLALVAAGWLGIIGTAHAQPVPIQIGDDPALIDAAEITYDRDLRIITARGEVEIARGERILKADTVSYNVGTNLVTASGNLVLLEPTGEVVFAEYMELSGDLAEGFIQRLYFDFGDDIRLGAVTGSRSEDRLLTLNRAVYSACPICRDRPDKEPLWQIKAEQISYDEATKDIEYRNAQFEMFGVPVAYLPYFRHPDPSADRRSGWLRPEAGITEDLGGFYRQPYFLVLSPQSDITFEAMAATRTRPLVGVELRNRFDSGLFSLGGSITVAERRDGTGANRVVSEDAVRGRLYGTGRFELDDNWRWGYDLSRTTDDSFLRVYRYGSEDVLTSRLFAERFEGRDYVSVDARAYQDTRNNNDDLETPLVLPRTELEWIGAPGSFLGGRLEAQGGFTSLYRSTDRDTVRFDGTGAWQRRLLTGLGSETTVDVGGRSHLYLVRDQLDSAGEQSGLIQRTRLLPYALATTRLPLARGQGAVREIIEPIAQIRLMPQLGDDTDYPNEDSRDLEFDDSNLFQVTRYPGYDRVDGGNRLAYGVRYSVLGQSGGATHAFLGQSYNLTEDDDFQEGSGMEERLSDIVGRLEVHPISPLNLDFRFQLDRRELVLNRTGVTAGLDLGRFKADLRYARADATVIDGNTIKRREEISGGFTFDLSDRWTIAARHRHDLTEGGQPLTSSIEILYGHPCISLGLAIERDETEPDGVDPGTSALIRLQFKTLGGTSVRSG